ATLRHAFWADGDIEGVDLSLVPGKQASMLLCRAVLRHGSHPERSVEKLLDRIFVVGLIKHNSVVAQRRAIVAGMVLDAESLVKRGVERAELTHFTGDPTVLSKNFHVAMSVDGDRLGEYSARYFTRERARAFLVMPLPGETPPPRDEEAVEAAPLDEEPVSFD